MVGEDFSSLFLSSSVFLSHPKFNYHLLPEILQVALPTMGGLSNSDGLAIAEIVIYTPLVVLSFALCIRHSFRVFAGWLFLFIFCALRIAGSALLLARINDPSNVEFYTVPIELFAVGQVVLLYSTLGLLARVADGFNQIWHTGIKSLYIQLIRLPLIAGIVLIVIGGVASASTWILTGNYPVDLLTKIGTIIVVAAFAPVAGVALLFSPRVAEADRSDVILFNAVRSSLVFIFIRLVYSLLIAFVDDAAFNPLNANAAAQGFMAVLDEAVAVILYVVAGFRISRLPKKTVVKNESDWSRRWNRVTGGIQRIHNFAHRITPKPSRPAAVAEGYRKGESAHSY
jgi:hypothetical protein